jgi:glyoxylase-like metal-dependent hydrolase (beta-lactamase superfamily II)
MPARVALMCVVPSHVYLLTVHLGWSRLISPKDVQQVVLTHLHTDHAGGIAFGARTPDAHIMMTKPIWNRGMERPVCLITGATDGVGKFTALELAQRGITVVFAARDQAKAERIKATIMAMGCGEVDYVLADLSSLQA